MKRLSWRRLIDLGAHPIVAVAAGCAIVTATVARFLITTPLWLDEALSVNIASAPLSEITERLRHDGHPPLYYFLLHFWMDVFGSGDGTVRAMSGIISLLGVPLCFQISRYFEHDRERQVQLGTTISLAYLLSPFVLRFGSETRMYSLVVVLVLAGMVLFERSIREPTLGRLAGIAAISGALLWTHYWAIWLLLALGGLCMIGAIRARRSHDRDHSNAYIRIALAMVVGGATFLPWVPTLVFQAQHTGTPWAKPFRPSSLIIVSLFEFGGGPYAEPEILAVLMAILVVFGIFGYSLGHDRIEIVTRPQRELRRLGWALIATIGLASVAGLVTGMAFAPRYAAVFFPLFLVPLGLGLHRFSPGVARNVVLSAFVVLSLVGLWVVYRLPRTQAGEFASRLEAQLPTALVVVCPDQLGPSISRAVGESDRFEVVAYPRLDAPTFVDWVDYKERNASIDDTAVAQVIRTVAGDRPVVIAFRDDFVTLEGRCTRLITALSTTHQPRQLLKAGDKEFEPVEAVVLTRQ